MPDPDNSHGLFYRRLDVRPEASREEIVHAYRRLAHGAHPDINPGDPDAARRFREITEAYEVLTDPSRRASYDRTRGGGPIRVVVGPTEKGSPKSPWAHEAANSSPAVFLGGSNHRVADQPLRAGPARVEQPSQGRSDREGGPEQLFVELFARIIDAWRRH